MFAIQSRNKTENFGREKRKGTIVDANFRVQELSCTTDISTISQKFVKFLVKKILVLDMNKNCFNED